MRKKLLLAFLLTALVPFASRAQVDDVTFILSPKAEYNWFDDNTTVDDGLMYGFDVGFAFGNTFELRGIFRQSVDLSQTFGEYQNEISDFLDEEDFSFDSRNIRVRRFGGLLKANIPVGDISPYLILGTGVQIYQRDLSDGQTLENETIYASLGLGLKFNITERITFDVAGKTFIYNLDPGSFLYDPNAPSGVDDFIDNLDNQRMYNWAVSAGLSFYLGGINREELTPLEKAYLRRYSGKLYDVKFTLAPAGSYVNFDNKSGFKDTYLLGGMVGVDFNDYFGLQAYYFHNTEGEDLSFDFGNLAMFGLDFVGRLNIPRGIVPYITVGGGYINAYEGYQGKFYDDTVPPEEQELDSKFYVKGGVGVEIPISTYFSLFGSASLLYTKGDESTDVADISSVDQLRQHSMFTVGLRFRFGKKADTEEAIERAFENRIQLKRYSYEQKIKDLKEKLNKAFKENNIAKMEKIMREIIQLEKKAQDIDKENQLIRKPSNGRIDSLKLELFIAFENGNINRVKQIMRKKQEIEARNNRLSGAANAKGMVRMTPEELQSLINETINQVVQEADTTTIEERLERIEWLILNLPAKLKGLPATSFRVRPDQQQSNQLDSGVKAETARTLNDPQNEGANGNAITKELTTKIEQLIQMLENQNARINQLQEALRTQDQEVRIPERDVTVVRTPDALSRDILLYNNERLDNSLSAFAGYTFGEVNSVNVGVRKYYGLIDLPFFLMGEVYLAIAQNYGIGASINGVYPFDIESQPRLNPYAGIGFGVNFIDGNFSLNPNFIIGTFYRLGGLGSVFFDYTVRGNFKYNQLAVGYKFSL